MNTPANDDGPGKVAPDVKTLLIEADILSGAPDRDFGTAGPDAPGAAQAKRQSIAEEWQGAVELGAAFLTKTRPELAAVWTAERVKELGEALGAVAEKRGWRLEDWMTAYAAEFALLCVALPLLRDTLQAIKDAKAAKKADPGGTIKAGEGAPSSKATVQARDTIKANT